MPLQSSAWPPLCGRGGEQQSSTRAEQHGLSKRKPHLDACQQRLVDLFAAVHVWLPIEQRQQLVGAYGHLLGRWLLLLRAAAAAAAVLAAWLGQGVGPPQEVHHLARQRIANCGWGRRSSGLAACASCMDVAESMQAAAGCQQERVNGPQKGAAGVWLGARHNGVPCLPAGVPDRRPG